MVCLKAEGGGEGETHEPWAMEANISGFLPFEMRMGCEDDGVETDESERSVVLLWSAEEIGVEQFEFRV